MGFALTPRSQRPIWKAVNHIPLRSSYRAGRLWAKSMIAKGREIPEELKHLADKLEFAQASAIA